MGRPLSRDIQFPAVTGHPVSRMVPRGCLRPGIGYIGEDLQGDGSSGGGAEPRSLSCRVGAGATRRRADVRSRAA